MMEIDLTLLWPSIAFIVAAVLAFIFGIKLQIAKARLAQINESLKTIEEHVNHIYDELHESNVMCNKRLDVLNADLSDVQARLKIETF